MQGAVVLVTSAIDVSTTLLFCKEHKLDFAVRGGGHSTSGASSTAGGIVIDLSEMRKVEVNPVEKTITAQGGCLWQDVDEAAGKYGLATVGGTVNHTGIGGLTLGGGYGWLAGKYGLTIDNLLEVQLVLANGDVVRTSEKENTDLFWAVRGAGQSFGVAIEFKYRAHEEKNPVWAGTLLFTPDKLDGVLSFANHVGTVSKGERATIVGFAAPPPVRTPLILALVFYNGPEGKALEFFGPLLDLGPVVKMVSMMPYSSLNGIINPAVLHGGRKVNKGTTYAVPMRKESFHSVFDDFSQFLKEISDAGNSMIAFEMYATAKVCEFSNTATAFASRGSYENSLISLEWKDKADDAACRMFARMMAEKFRAEMERGKREGDIKLQVEGVGEYGNSDGIL